MRRALAAAVLGISLWLGSLAWTGFVLLRTVLDPERSREVAETLYEDDTVRAQLAENVADGIAAALPPGVPVPADAIEAGAADVLASPAVEALFVDALARTHAAFLGEGDAPRTVDPAAFGAAARDAVAARNPELAPVLPASPQLTIPLPTSQIPDLGPARDAIAAAVPLLALASLAGTVLALLVTSNRPAVLRRAGAWAMGLSATVLLLAYGVPYVAEALLPGQAAVIAALVRAVAEATRVPALSLAAAGLACVVVAAAWRRAPSPRPAAAPPPRRHRHHRPARTRASHRPVLDRAPSPTVVAPAAPPLPETSADATAVDGGAPSRSRWVEGVGWVLEPSTSIPPDARWVPGVGYVVDER